MINTASEKRLSSVLESMRFPLIFLVVIAHMVPFDSPRVTLSWHAQDIYTLISEMISHNLARLSVRCYFLISGYYVFKKMIQWEGFYTSQLKKKISTLLIPYLFWNVLLVIAVVLKHHLFLRMGWGPDEGYPFISTASLYTLLWGGPANFPLWYLRDLLCMILLIPFFYYWFHFTKVYGLLLFMGCYLGLIESHIPGFSTTAFTFFGAGAYLAMFNKDLLALCQRFCLPSLIMAVILLGLATAFNGTAHHEYIVRLFILVGVVGIINVFDLLQHNPRVQSMLRMLAPSSFFIYVVHEIYIINWLKGAWAKLTAGSSAWLQVAGYFLVPCLCLIVCLGLFRLVKRTSPGLLGLLTGGRINPYVFKAPNTLEKK